jgi:hypothetical protein
MFESLKKLNELGGARAFAGSESVGGASNTQCLCAA